MNRMLKFGGLVIVTIMSLISCSQENELRIAEDSIDRTSKIISLAEAEADLNKLLDDIYMIYNQLEFHVLERKLLQMPLQ